jgi:hypothetical protein
LIISPERDSARCEEVSTFWDHFSVNGNSIKINILTRGRVVGIPPAGKPETWYIVSALVAKALPERGDLLVVDELVRGGYGRVIGCNALARLEP